MALSKIKIIVIIVLKILYINKTHIFLFYLYYYFGCIPNTFDMINQLRKPGFCLLSLHYIEMKDCQPFHQQFYTLHSGPVMDFFTYLNIFHTT